MRPIFQSLRKLKIDISRKDSLAGHTHYEPRVAEFYHAHLRSGRFRDLITSTSKLRDLRLFLGVSRNSDFPYSFTTAGSLHSLVGHHTWDHLRCIHLHAIETSEEETLHFLRRHTVTLRELKLENMHLIRGSWVSIS